MSAVAEAPAAPPLSWTSKFSSLDRSRRLRLAAGAAMLVGIAIAAVVMMRQPDWRVLYANLGDKDGGAIVAQLAQMNIPYRYSEGGGAVMVPAEKVHDLRLRLASQGLPKGSVAGFESMENNRFGMTQFQEKLSFQRGLEGELTRSIQALASVQAARVHLALPNQNGFFREQQKPSASVLLTLHPGRTLERGQVAGIVHLVASSVPELSPAAVSVVDDSGKLLSATGEAPGSADTQQLQYVQQIEQQYTRRITDLLAPVVGRENVRAQVTADVDFSQVEATSEEHKPNLAAEASAVRSQQTIESTGQAAANPPSGVPGAASNQPPGPSSAPINGSAAPLAPAPGAATAAGARPPGKRESITNYEVDKTVKTIRSATGQIRRLSAAVVVNYQAGADGKPVALPPAQIEQMTALVREAVGFSKDRGDSVNLMHAPFMVDQPVNVDTPIWKRPELLDLARNFAWPAALALIAAMVLFGMVRPGLKVVAKASPPALPGPRLDAMVEENLARPALAASPEANALPAPADAEPEHARLEGARQMARQNPVAMANIVKTWVNGDAASGA